MIKINYDYAIMTFDNNSNRIIIRQVEDKNEYIRNGIYSSSLMLKDLELNLNTASGFIEVHGTKINLVSPGRCILGYKLLDSYFISIVNENDQKGIFKLLKNMYLIKCRDYLSNIESKFQRKFQNVSLEIIDYDTPDNKIF